ncbi:trigger factor [Desulfuromonas versatilis]|uniref:Trigger factor n=1 Tax=Desulfuromonas versatilis TaxID=2802975 RepID=A0ABM8HY89_9BACT|nr:trigger factor [Desulfuromonas versatilis]BCR05779.1 trigger factor [Desulfuromonas versatilis]
MTVQVENISSVKKKLSFEVPAETVSAEIEKAYQKIAKTAKIKGFRQGKVPRGVIEKYYAPQMEEQVLNRLINDTYFKAIVDNRIAAVSDPEIVEGSGLEPGKPFTYQAEVEVKPEVEVKDYTGLSLQREKFEADPKMVESRLDEMRASRAQMEVAERDEAKEGDFLNIAFEGFMAGQPFDGGKSDDHVLELGSGSFIPGFEAQLEGMKRGEEREIEVTFPEDYGNKQLAGQPATFKVKVKEIKAKVLPELDDEFAKGFGLESLEELRGKIDENYQTQEKNRVEGDLKERLMDELIARNPFDVPEAMVASQLKYMLENIRNRMQSQGMSLEMLGMNEESFGQMYRDTAVNQVKGSLILEAIARQENLKVEGSEIDDKLLKIAEMANAPLDAVKKYYAGDDARQGLMAQMLEEKVLEFLFEKSTVVDVAKEELAGADKDQE